MSLKIVKNKTQARKEINNYVKSIGSIPYDFDDINLNRKYPVILRLSGLDLSNMRGSLQTMVYFHPITKEIKRGILESML